MDIGSLVGSIEFEDNFTSKLGGVANSLLGFTDKFGSQVSKLSDSTSEGLEKTTTKVENFATAFSRTLTEAAENPVQAFENLSKEIGTKLVESMKAVGPEVAVVTAGLAGMVGAVVAIDAAVFAFAKHAAEAGEGALDFSDRTGIAVENVGALEFAAKSVGASLGEVTQVMKFMERGSASADAATGKFGKALQDMGLNAKEFIALDSESKLFKLAEGLRHGSDSGHLMADAMAIMGRNGQQAITWVNDLTPEMLKLGESMGIAWNRELVEKAEAFNIEMGVVKTALGNVGTQIGIVVLPKIEELLRKFTESPTSAQKLLETIDTLAHSLGALVAVAGLATVYIGKLGQEILIQAGRAATAWYALFPTKENLQRLVSLAGALKTVTDATDLTYNVSKDLSKALSDVNLALDKTHAAASNPALNKQSKDMDGLTESAKAAQKAFDEVYDSISGKKSQERADQLEKALAKLFEHGTVDQVVKAMKDLGKEANDLANSGVKLGTRMQDVNHQFLMLPQNLIYVNDNLGMVERTIGGITGKWQQVQLGAAPIPDSFIKITNAADTSVLSIGRIVNITQIWDKEIHDLDLQRHIDNLHNYGAALQVAGQSMGGFVGDTLNGLGQLISAWANYSQQLKDANGNLAKLTASQKALAAAQGVSSVLGATGGGSLGSRAVGGALAGAGAGLMFAPETLGLSIAIGASIGALTGIIRGLAAQASEARDVMTSFVRTFRDGLDGLSNRVKTLGPEGEKLWAQLAGAQASGDKDRVVRAIEDVQRALDDLDRDVERYGLTWADMWNPIDRLQGSNRAAKDLLDTIKRLTTAGYDARVVTSRMAGDVNDWLAATLKAGLKIPAAMQPIVEQLIKSKQLTEDNARALLGLADDGVPSLEDVTAATERWGIKLDDAGDKVQQLRLNEIASQIVKDFATMTAAGVPFDVIMKSSDEKVKGMRDSIQDMVNKSLGPLGLTLPAAMKPIIDALIKAGGPNGLTDQFGNALTDIGQLHFEKPLVDAVQELIDKLGELIDTIIGPGGVNDSLTSIPPPGGRTRPPGTPPSGTATPRNPESAAGGTPETPTSGGGGATPRPATLEVVTPVTLRIGSEAVTREVVRTLVDVGT